METALLESYSKAIAEEFPEDRDAMEVMAKLAKNPRDEYEAKIPELGNLLGMIREHAQRKLAAKREQEQKRALDEYLDDLRANPENYVSMAEIMQEYQAKQAKKQAAAQKETA
jgi:FMN-dependent NADH-azoreductase